MKIYLDLYGLEGVSLAVATEIPEPPDYATLEAHLRDQADDLIVELMDKAERGGLLGEPRPDDPEELQIWLDAERG